MKVLQGVTQISGSWVTSLVDPEDLGILRLEQTGEGAEGLDLEVLWNREWHEGRSYASFAGPTFVTTKGVKRLPLAAGMQVRLPLYTLDADGLLDLALTYLRELGYTPIQAGIMIDGDEPGIVSGEQIEWQYWSEMRGRLWW